jgi:hypothetical protein
VRPLSLLARPERSPEAEAVSDGLYAWQVYEQGAWGTIGVMLINLGDEGNWLSVGERTPVPLITRSREIAEKLYREHALDHHERTELPVRLVRMEPVETLELFPHAEG